MAVFFLYVNLFPRQTPTLKLIIIVERLIDFFGEKGGIIMSWELDFYHLIKEELKKVSFSSYKQYVQWLKTEIGLTETIIFQLRQDNMLPVPCIA